MTDSLSWLTTPTKWHIYNTMCIISNCSDREHSPPWLDQLSASMPLKSCKKICSSQLQEGKRQCIGTLVWLTNSWHKEKVQLWVSSTVQVSGLLAVTVLLKLMTFMKRLVVDGPWIGSWIRVFFLICSHRAADQHPQLTALCSYHWRIHQSIAVYATHPQNSMTG